MWENLLLDDETIDIEMDRIKLVFEKENYDDEQKKWYLESVCCVCSLFRLFLTYPRQKLYLLYRSI